ncbi:hypothetical protein ACLOJK_023274 [Asimina triloba]
MNPSTATVRESGEEKTEDGDQIGKPFQFSVSLDLGWQTASCFPIVFRRIVRNVYLVFSQYVMIVLKGSVPMSFGGTEQPAAYGELVSIGGLNPDVNKKLSAAIATILETKLSVSKARFFLKFYDSKASYLNLCC